MRMTILAIAILTAMTKTSLFRAAPFLIVFFLLQAICTAIFLLIILACVIGLQFRIDYVRIEVIEIGAAFGLITGLVTTALLLRKIRRRAEETERKLQVAAGAFQTMMREQFTQWSLTPAERDIALFVIKGMTTSEISGLRQTSLGTVKAQMNSIYRKAGVSSRSQLACVFIDTLMGEQLIPAAANG